MNKFVVAYTGGTHPIFIEDESFRSLIPMVTYLVGENYQLYLHLADLTKDQLGQERIEQLKGLSLDARLKNVEDWDELAITLGGSWQEKKGELEKLRLLINNNLTIANLKKRGSWEEKTGELLQKRTRILLAVLLLTILPISIEELTAERNKLYNGKRDLKLKRMSHLTKPSNYECFYQVFRFQKGIK